MLDRLRCAFHHLGVACRDLDRESLPWLALGYRVESQVFEDPIQGVKGQFLVGPGPRLELLASLAPDQPVASMVRRGITLYHQGYETPLFDQTVAALSEANNKLVKGPVPAVAFGGRQIAFFVLPNMNIVEIIEKVSVR
jgi:methylmalonyl-CoA/ethylmalonyl-CoA epimerase